MKNNYFETKEFNNKFNYDGTLGVIYSNKSSEFKLWAPTAEKVELLLYGKNSRDIDVIKRVVKMNKENKGVWKVVINEDLDGEFYNYLVKNNEKT